MIISILGEDQSITVLNYKSHDIRVQIMDKYYITLNELGNNSGYAPYLSIHPTGQDNAISATDFSSMGNSVYGMWYTRVGVDDYFYDHDSNIIFVNDGYSGAYILPYNGNPDLMHWSSANGSEVSALNITGRAGDDILRAPSGTLESVNLYGGIGNDSLYGGEYTDTLVGGLGNDAINGDAGDDRIWGSAGDDILNGGAGVDTLFGGLGADVFVFEKISALGNSDKIQDFNLSEGDVIDISDLLTPIYSDPLTQAITDFVQITDNGTDSILSVDIDGGADNFVQIATIYGVTGITDEDALVTSGNLLVA